MTSNLVSVVVTQNPFEEQLKGAMDLIQLTPPTVHRSVKVNMLITEKKSLVTQLSCQEYRDTVHAYC